MNVISQDAAGNLSTSDNFLFSSDKTIGIPTGVPGITVLLSWLCPRYQYHFLLELIFLNSALLMRPMAYFYSHLRTGNKYDLIDLHINLCNIYFFRKAKKS